MDNNILLNSKNIIFEPHISNSSELPFIYHYDKVTHPARANIHENIELLFFTAGDANVKYDSNIYSVKKNDVVVINSYCIHQVIPVEYTEYFCLIIDKSFCNFNSIDSNNLIFDHIVCDDKLNKILKKLIKETTSQNIFKYTAIKAYVLETLLFICQNYSKPNESQISQINSSFDYIRKAVEYIKSNINQKQSVDEVASHVGLSKYHFLREFKKITGCTFTNYVNLIKCEYAQEILRDKKHSVKEVAMLCGFDNYSYFATVFKKNTSLLPSEYIKQI